MVECTSRYVILTTLEVPAAEAAAQAIVREMSWMAPSILKNMMLDQGSEMARDAEKHSGNGDEVSFRRSHSPWYRGSNKNTNGLLRQLLKKAPNSLW